MMIYRMKWLAVLCLLLSAGARAQWVRADAQTIKFSGDIGRDSYQAYQDAAKGGYSKVILQSAGGSPLPALMIAEDMRKHQPAIAVDGYCLSACANYLLLASPAPTVPCGALVIWHGSPSVGFSEALAAMRAENKNSKLIEHYAKWANDFSVREASYYAAIGIDKKLLSDSVKIVRREHVAPESTFNFDELTGDYSETISSGLWIPTREVIESYGIQVKNFCRTYDREIPAARKQLGIMAPYTSAGP